METKICGSCTKDLPLDKFNKNNSKKDGLQAWCAFCSSNYHKTRYPAKANEQFAANKRNKKLRVDLVESIKRNTPCLDCGGHFKKWVMEFDHRDSTTKTASIANMVHSMVSMEVLQEEIDKCDLVCANCHRIRTAERAGWAD